MKETIRALVQQRDICVLATTEADRPHCSLMAYVVDQDCRTIYLATHRDTRKYRNLVRNPNVSLLIDNRSDGVRAKTKALTVAGVCTPMENKALRSRIEGRMLTTHPHLKAFLAHPDAVIVSVRVVSYLLLDGVSEATYEAV